MDQRTALKIASECISLHGRGTSWVIYGPHDNDDIGGPSTEMTADSYHRALDIAKGWKLGIAAGLLGLGDDTQEDLQYAMYNGDLDGIGLRDALAAAVRSEKIKENLAS